jgi:peroxiredoxin
MTLEVGAPAPEFELRDQHGQKIRLSGFRDRKHVVLVFYPYAFTRVCTAEMCEIRDELAAFQNDTVQVLAISTDTVFTLRVFGEQEGLEFPLLSDFWPHGAVARSYGVFDEQHGCAIRGTFIVGKDGALHWRVVNAIPDARNQAEYLKVLGGLS